VGQCKVLGIRHKLTSTGKQREALRPWIHQSIHSVYFGGKAPGQSGQLTLRQDQRAYWVAIEKQTVGPRHFPRALVPGPLKFWGLRPKGPIPFTEFKASGVDMYFDLKLALLGPCPIQCSPKIGGLTYPPGKFYANFWNISEGSPDMSLGLWSTQDSADNFLGNQNFGE
jgi:hypothetical protein